VSKLENWWMMRKIEVKQIKRYWEKGSLFGGGLGGRGDGSD